MFGPRHFTRASSEVKGCRWAVVARIRGATCLKSETALRRWRRSRQNRSQIRNEFHNGIRSLLGECADGRLGPPERLLVNTVRTLPIVVCGLQCDSSGRTGRKPLHGNTEGLLYAGIHGGSRYCQWTRGHLFKSIWFLALEAGKEIQPLRELKLIQKDAEISRRKWAYAGLLGSG